MSQLWPGFAAPNEAEEAEGGGKEVKSVDRYLTTVTAGASGETTITLPGVDPNATIALPIIWTGYASSTKVQAISGRVTDANTLTIKYNDWYGGVSSGAAPIIFLVIEFTEAFKTMQVAEKTLLNAGDYDTTIEAVDKAMIWPCFFCDPQVNARAVTFELANATTHRFTVSGGALGNDFDALCIITED